MHVHRLRVRELGRARSLRVRHLRFRNLALRRHPGARMSDPDGEPELLSAASKPHLRLLYDRLHDNEQRRGAILQRGRRRHLRLRRDDVGQLQVR